MRVVRFVVVLAAGLLAYSTAYQATSRVIAPTASTARPRQLAFRDPGASSAFSRSRRAIRLLVGRTSDQWVGVDHAPRLLVPQPGEPWSVDTHIVRNTGGTRTFGGLVVFRDAKHWILWGQTGDGRLEASGVVENVPTAPIATMADRFEYLRVRRLGRRYAFDASQDGRHWTNANVFDDTAGALDEAGIGVLAKGWNGAAPFEMAFEYVREAQADAMPSALAGVERTELVAQQTGTTSINRTDAVDVCGLDLGQMFDWNGRIYLAFGDTRGCGAAPAWRSNTMAFTTDTNPGDGLSFDGWVSDAEGRARELFRKDASAVTVIPTGAVAVDDRAFVYYMQVTDWKTWRCDLSSVASATSADPATWTKHEDAVLWRPGNFSMVGVLRQGPTLYVYGTPCGRRGAVKLMRVDAGRVLDRAAYRYFAGFDGRDVRWSESEADAITVAGGPASELSITFNRWLGRFTMSYLDEPKGAIVVREAPLPWGPWSAPVTMTTRREYPEAYGAFMHPALVADGGRTVYYVMSMWGPYNTYLMKTTFIGAGVAPRTTPAQ